MRDGIENVQHLTKGDVPAAWGMARQYAENMAEACRVAEIELAHHEAVKANPMAHALLRIIDQPWVEVKSVEELQAALDGAATASAQASVGIPTETPEEHEALDRIEQAHPTPATWTPDSLREDATSVFSKLLAPFRPTA
jgi:hypothetical protein